MKNNGLYSRARISKFITVFLIMIISTSILFNLVTAKPKNGKANGRGNKNGVKGVITLKDETCLGEVKWVYEDTSTKGDWKGFNKPVSSPVGTYGSYAYILPGAPGGRLEHVIGTFTPPLGYNSLEEFLSSGDQNILYDNPYIWTVEQVLGLGYYKASPPYHDEYVGSPGPSYPKVTYYIVGTFMDGIQQPAFEWAWEPWHNTPPWVRASDPREVYYQFINPTSADGTGWRFAAWDDGGERCKPLNGYIDYYLTFPKGTYQLALYAYDKENNPQGSFYARYNQSYLIYNELGELLVETVVGEAQLNTGAYEVYNVYTPCDGFKIRIRVYNLGGHNDFDDFIASSEDYTTQTLNVVLSGVFVDRLDEFLGTGTPGYWMNHPETWPVESIEIGGVTYPKKDAIEHMKNETNTDMTYSMFQALVAAKLNVMIGNDDSCIADIIDLADEWMAEHPLDSGVGGSSDAWETGETLKDMLDEYNNGLLPCAPSRDALE